MTLQGHIENGRVVLDVALAVPDGTRVEVIVIPTPVSAASSDDKDRERPTLYERMKPVIGIADLPPDASQNIDHYLYGHPKK
jgi:hypothetical protein